MTELAELSDVAIELGLDGEDDMSDNQQARALGLIARVSELFEHEAQRNFAPGLYTQRLRVQYSNPHEASDVAWVYLPEPPDTVTMVKDDEGNIIPGSEWSVSGRRLTLKQFIYGAEHRFSTHIHTAYYVTVTYSHSNAIPAAVRQVVASIVARYLSLSTTAGAIAPVAASLSDALGNRVTFAQWVTKSVHLTPEDLAVARRYRLPAQSMVVGT